MKERKPRSGGVDSEAPTHRAPVETKVLAKFPAFIQHLAVTRLDGGKTRRPGVIIFMSSGAGYRIIAKEPDPDLEMEVYAEFVDDAMKLMEALLASDEAPWVPDRRSERGQKRGKK